MSVIMLSAYTIIVVVLSVVAPYKRAYFQILWNEIAERWEVNGSFKKYKNFNKNFGIFFLFITYSATK